MSVELKPCPFCGGKLCKKHVRKTKSRNGYDYYMHPDNECILADVFDGFPLMVYDNDVDDWNRRAESVNCEAAEHDGSGCLGYSTLNDDEPIDRCKYCEKYTGNRRTET